mgnify:CR=1 FL=1
MLFRSASFTYFRGNKEKFGRGASATRPDETTYNQTGPSSMYKGEINWTASNALYLTARYAYFKNGAPVLLGGTGNDLLYGESSSDDPDDRTLRDALYGEGGRDVLDGGADTDYMEGGGDGDTYPFDADLQLGYDTIHEESSPLGGNDTLDFSLTSTAVDIDLADATEQIIGGLTVSFPANVIENVTGGSGSDRLSGNSLNNILVGNMGDDVLIGLGGDDNLDGGVGNDTYVYDADLPFGPLRSEEPHV